MDRLRKLRPVFVLNKDAPRYIVWHALFVMTLISLPIIYLSQDNRKLIGALILAVVTIVMKGLYVWTKKNSTENGVCYVFLAAGIAFFFVYVMLFFV